MFTFTHALIHIGTKRDKTGQGQKGTKRVPFCPCPFLSLFVLFCPCPVLCPCLSLFVPVHFCPFLSFFVPVLFCALVCPCLFLLLLLLIPLCLCLHLFVSVCFCFSLFVSVCGLFCSVVVLCYQCCLSCTHTHMHAFTHAPTSKRQSMHLLFVLHVRLTVPKMSKMEQDRKCSSVANWAQFQE